jgi:DNA mismatch repair protein MutS
MIMTYSILFPEGTVCNLQKNQPACFKDLGLDQLFTGFTAASDEIRSVLYTPLSETKVIQYRQDVMRDLENRESRELFSDFANLICNISGEMNTIRKTFPDFTGPAPRYAVQGRLFYCAERYCNAVTECYEKSRNFVFKSAGLSDCIGYLKKYCNSTLFVNFSEAVKSLLSEADRIHYCMLIKDRTLRIRKYEDQPDSAERIHALFDRFRQGDVREYRRIMREEPYDEHVEEAVLHILSELYKKFFSGLRAFCSAYTEFEDKVLLKFADELKFYLFWIMITIPLKERGLSFCFPAVQKKPDGIFVRESFDVVLASKKGGRVVTNDITMNTTERIIVVTGPNQGGKTTYARAFGQIQYLALLGLTVPGTGAQVKLFDTIYTHFERNEDLSSGNGKLQDDLLRLHDIFKTATADSIIIVNEIFSSTTAADAAELGMKMMDMIAALGAVSVVVTFLDELARHGPETVSMMSMVDSESSGRRNFKIERKPPDGLAYALQIAEKYGLTYESLNRRLNTIHECTSDVQ